jgi:toxin ParE1/3/4
MTLPVVFRTVARVEFDEASDWYELRRAGRGKTFAAKVRQALDRIADQPKLYAEVFQDIREVPVSGYPYRVYYREEPTQVVVLAVFHTSRDPSIWQRRI